MPDPAPPARTLAEWAWRYPGRGYGGRFAAWLKAWELAPYGSFGNGAAMRVSPAAPLARSCVAPNVSSKRHSCDTFS